MLLPTFTSVMVELCYFILTTRTRRRKTYILRTYRIEGSCAFPSTYLFSRRPSLMWISKQHEVLKYLVVIHLFFLLFSPLLFKKTEVLFKNLYISMPSALHHAAILLQMIISVSQSFTRTKDRTPTYGSDASCNCTSLNDSRIEPSCLKTHQVDDQP